MSDYPSTYGYFHGKGGFNTMPTLNNGGTGFSVSSFNGSHPPSGTPFLSHEQGLHGGSSYGASRNEPYSDDGFPPIGVFDINSCGIENVTDKTKQNLVPKNDTTVADNSANQVNRETGIIEKLLHSYGFIQCCERQARLFFHFSQCYSQTGQLRTGDVVEFEMNYDKRTGKPVATNVTKLTPNIPVNGRVVGVIAAGTENGEKMGCITYENNGQCYFLPFGAKDIVGENIPDVGDKVSCEVTTDQKGSLTASCVHLETTRMSEEYQNMSFNFALN